MMIICCLLLVGMLLIDCFFIGNKGMLRSLVSFRSLVVLIALYCAKMNLILALILAVIWGYAAVAVFSALGRCKRERRENARESVKENTVAPAQKNEKPENAQAPVCKITAEEPPDADTGKKIGALTVETVTHFEDDKKICKSYRLSDNVQADHVWDIIAFFEAETAVMTKCNCQSFDDDGHPLHRCYADKDELYEIKDFPNPYIRFYVHFKSNETNEYAFALEMHINSNVVCHIVDKLKRKEAECPAEVSADIDNSTNGAVQKDKLIFERDTRYVDEKHFLHCVRDAYFLTAQERITKKTTTTIADAHNLARTTQNETSFVISAEELTADMHASDPQLGIQECSKFGGSLDQVLAVKHETGIGFEKSVERKAILFSNGRYYLQHITRRVVAEGNGRPITQYSESVYPISTTDINVITPENVEKYIGSEPVFEDIQSKEGVGF